ncbi:MAG TPA: dTMP kinase [Oligoflexia bacterium]|nr:dTMP kinase [Oligoflexia bacterium]HMR24420.1 dTMP kinase [Oligoflexia bacterium]
MKKATFIVFEGIEGVGKSTQVKLLCDFLQSQGKNVVSTREPGGTPQADEIRKCIVRSGKGSMLPLTELFLIEAARKEHVEKVIKPQLKLADYIICDRYIYSSLAYQGYACGLDLDTVNMLNQLATDNTLPDQVILLDAEPALGIQRSLDRLAQQQKGHREDRFENEALDFHQRVRQGFLSLAKTNELFTTLNANQSISQLHAEILKMLGLKQ